MVTLKIHMFCVTVHRDGVIKEVVTMQQDSQGEP